MANPFRRFLPRRNHPKGVSIFFARDQSCVLVAALHLNGQGIYVEQAEPRRLEGPPEPEALGRAFRQAFDAFFERDQDLSRRRVADWPALRASGLRSKAAFDKRFLPVGVFAVNEANLIVEASARYPVSPGVPEDAGFQITVAFNPLLDEAEIGDRLIRLAQLAGLG